MGMVNVENVYVMCMCACTCVVVVVVVGKVRRNPGGAAILTCKSFDILGEGGERQTEPSHGWFPPTFPQVSWS